MAPTPLHVYCVWVLHGGMTLLYFPFGVEQERVKDFRRGYCLCLWRWCNLWHNSYLPMISIFTWVILCQILLECASQGMTDWNSCTQMNGNSTSAIRNYLKRLEISVWLRISQPSLHLYLDGNSFFTYKQEKIKLPGKLAWNKSQAH